MSKVLAGRYELFERIGEGGMSVVYKAKDKLLNRFVAIKILKPEFINDHKFIDSFRRESQAAASLSHPNIVNIYDVGREGNIHYIVMELIEGRALSEYIKEQGAMPYPKVIALSKQIAAALSFAHKNHIIHRDVKPHNIMITPNGTAKITDFGIAKAVNAATIVDNTDGVIGSVHYFSPEQARGGYVDEKSDIYSLGIVMYEMLTGNVPFDGDNPVNIALMHINGEMTPPSKVVDGVPPALEHIIMKCTDKYPVNRYASADELIQALNNLEFVGSVVGNSILMNNEGRRRREPIAETDLNEGPEDIIISEREQDRRGKGNRMSPKKKKRIIIIGSIALALVLAFAILLLTGVIGGRQIECPSFLNSTVKQAQKAAEEYDLKIKEGDPVVSDTVEKGLIVSQEPEPGSQVKTGSTIVVHVSKGRGDGSVPNLIGKDQSQASDLLEAAGFKLGSVSTTSSQRPYGEIVSQDPGGGSEAEKGTAVNIVISDGSKAQVTMPYLIGRSLDEAKSLLSDAGLSAGKVSYDYSDTYTEGQVIWQQYDGNTQLDKGTSVKLRVSKGSKPTQAPTKPTQTEPEDEGDGEDIDDEE